MILSEVVNTNTCIIEVNDHIMRGFIVAGSQSPNELSFLAFILP